MSTVISITTYKNFQILIGEALNFSFYYEVNDPRQSKTVAINGKYNSAFNANVAAEAAVDAFPVTVAQGLVVTALSGNISLANDVILAILNGGYVILPSSQEIDQTDNDLDDGGDNNPVNGFEF
jgi:hypothetical protein